MEEIQEDYKEKKEEIRRKLQSFKELTEEERYKEFLFCLLTPQSNAQRCWEAVEELSKIPDFKEKKVNTILKGKTRFHNVKTKRILQAKNNWNKMKGKLENKDIKELRNEIAQEVNGYGLKEASHFLRNIGKSNNKIAILDRHILKNMVLHNIIEEGKIKGNKDYLNLENKFLTFSKNLGIKADELDFVFWAKENGEVFK